MKKINVSTINEVIEKLENNGYGANATELMMEIIVPLAAVKKCSLMEALRIYSKRSCLDGDMGPNRVNQALFSLQCEMHKKI